MSRAFSPPDTLSKDDIRTLGDVRRNIWTAGFTGLAYGSVTGFSAHAISKYVYNMLPEKQQLRVASSNGAPFRFTRNSAFLSVMVGGAVGSFVMATAAGKNRASSNLRSREKGGRRIDCWWDVELSTGTEEGKGERGGDS
jgi:hypothetical protein